MASPKGRLLSTPMVRRALAIASGALLLALAAAPAANAAPSPVALSVRPACGTPGPRQVRCHALVRTDIAPSVRALPAVRTTSSVEPAVAALYPAQLQAAYGLTAAAASSGSGSTVAIIDAYDDPTAESDLAVYRSNAGLPPCTTANGCFRKVDQNGGSSYPPADSGWSVEIALDLDMVSAICPNCSILLVEASSANIDDMGRSVNRAVAMGAMYISNSYGAIEGPGITTYDAYYDHPGLVVTASTGDNGYIAGVSFPASSNHVIAVGGTSLSWNGTTWVQQAWSGAGSGCSAYFAKPAWQHDSGCTKRMTADLAAEADPTTPVAIYNNHAWMGAGGTSASAPMIAAAYALAGAPIAGSYPASYPYPDNRGGLRDVTGGSNGSCSPAPAYFCTGGAGYDGPTGLGTPVGTTPFSAPGVPGKPTGATGVSGAPGSGSVTVSWAAPASDGGSAISAYTVTASPGGKRCTWSSGPLSCTVSGLTTGQPTIFTVTATNSVGTSPASDPSSAVIPVGPPGAPTGVVGSPGNGQVSVAWTAPALTGGSSITAYTVTSSPAAKTCTWTSGATACTVTGLANGTPYTFTVTATNGYGTGSPSAPSASVTPATVPDAPTSVVATPANAAATVTWAAPAWNGGAAVTSYTATSSPGGKTCSSSSPGVGCTVSGLVNGNPYTFSVTATNAAGTGIASAPSTAVTPRTVPGQPTGVTGVPGDASVKVSWAAPSSNGGLPVSSYRAVAAPGGASCTVAAPALTCSVSGLVNGQGYTFTVSATNGAGQGPASAASAPVVPRRVPGAPTAVTGMRGNGSVLVGWTAPASDGGAPITGYTVTASPGGKTCAWTGGLLACTVTGLVNGTPYTFTATATNAAGASVASAASAPVTPASLPGQPTVVSAAIDPKAATSVVAGWTAPDSGGSPITGYTATAYDATAFVSGMLVATGRVCTTAGTTCTITGLTPATSVIVRVTATTAVGTGLPSSPSASVAIPLLLPAASMTTLPRWTVASSLQLGWKALAGSYPVSSYNVESRRLGWSQTTFSARAGMLGLTSSGTAFLVSVGATYCFRVQAVDTQANAGPWSREVCTSTPLDDRSLARKGTWATGTGTGYYRGTWTRSTTLGASVVRTLVKAKSLVLVASTCPTCGSVRVYLGSTLLATISLKSSVAVAHRTIVVKSWSTVHSGTVTVKLSTSGRRVLIDGLGVSRI